MNIRIISLVAATLAIAAAAPASAETITKTGPQGGTATIDYGTTNTANGAIANGHVSVVGPNGGSGTGSFVCGRGLYRRGCVGSGSFTGASGNTWSGAGAIGAGPYRAGRVGAVTGPNGSEYIRRVWWR